MKTQRIAVAVTIVNLSILVITLTKMNTVNAGIIKASPEILRAKGLEIIDGTGKVRASITLMPPVTQDGKFYPEAVLFRLINKKGQPSVKIEAAENGGGMNLGSEKNGYIQILSHDDEGFLKIKNAKGEKVVQP